MSIWKTLRARIPHKVQIAKNKAVEIKWAEGFDDINMMGYCNLEKKEIVLKLKMSDKDTVVTFLHEVAHAVSDQYEMKMTEAQILKLEDSLYYLLKPDNLFTEKK